MQNAIEDFSNDVFQSFRSNNRKVGLPKFYYGCPIELW